MISGKKYIRVANPPRPTGPHRCPTRMSYRELLTHLGQQPRVVKAYVRRSAAHLIHLTLLLVLSLLEAVDLRLVALNGGQLVSQHAQRKEAEESGLDHQEDDVQVAAAREALSLVVHDAAHVAPQHQHDGVQAGHQHPEHEQQEQLVIAHADAVVHPPGKEGQWRRPRHHTAQHISQRRVE